MRELQTTATIRPFEERGAAEVWELFVPRTEPYRRQL